MIAPGKRLGNVFWIRVNVKYKKGQVIHTGTNLIVVLKTYHLTWWRKILKWFGVKLRDPNTYKVKYL